MSGQWLVKTVWYFKLHVLSDSAPYITVHLISPLFGFFYMLQSLFIIFSRKASASGQASFHCWNFLLAGNTCWHHLYSKHQNGFLHYLQAILAPASLKVLQQQWYNQSQEFSKIPGSGCKLPQLQLHVKRALGTHPASKPSLPLPPSPTAQGENLNKQAGWVPWYTAVGPRPL